MKAGCNAPFMTCSPIHALWRTNYERHNSGQVINLGSLDYMVVSTATSATELVANGDFSAGNSGFTTSYNFTHPMNYFPGNYDVNSVGTSFGDYTTGSGNMMIVDGAFAANPLQTVWQEVLAVTPNTDYLFETWARSITAGPLITLSFRANGSEVGTLSLVNPPSDSWQMFNVVWNSGSNTSITLNIVDLQTNNGVPGNDFALDDISFTNALPVAVPEPSALLLLSTGVLSLLSYGWSQRLSHRLR